MLSLEMYGKDSKFLKTKMRYFKIQSISTAFLLTKIMKAK